MANPDINICESIADPDTFDWGCPTCGGYNQAPFVIGECFRCGYEIDPDMFADALKTRDIHPTNGEGKL